MNTPTWTSRGTHPDGYICVDVKAMPDGVVLGQFYGAHHAAVSNLHMSADDAQRIAFALLDAAQKVREAQA